MPSTAAYSALTTLSWARSGVARSAENVVAEIEQIVKTYGVRQIDFLDDNIAFDRKRLETICDLLVQKRLHIEWCTPNGVRADSLDAELLAKMRAAGCQKILVAPESGVQRIVDDVIKKKQSLKQVEEVVSAAHKLGIKVGCFFIFGMIGETKEDMKETIKFRLETSADWELSTSTSVTPRPCMALNCTGKLKKEAS